MSKCKNVRFGGFDSKKEHKRYEHLRMLEAGGDIYNLRCQVPFELIPTQRIDNKVVERACKYIADFTYYRKNGEFVVEDVKSEYTRKLPDYIIKRKLMLWIWKIKVHEVL